MKEIDKFIAGFAQFRRNHFDENRELFDRLKQAQNPRALVVGCSDSRVDPALLLGIDPGDIFVVRNVANLVPPCEENSGHHGTSAALEFAVCNLEVSHIIVIGHSRCGGIAALMKGGGGRGENFIAKWMQIAEPARQRVLNELPHKPVELQTRACEQAAVLLSLENLLTFPWISEKVEHGKLHLHGWYFDMAAGELLGYDASRKVFDILRQDNAGGTTPDA